MLDFPLDASNYQIDKMTIIILALRLQFVKRLVRIYT